MRTSARIRLAGDSDADAIAAIYAPVVETTAISFETVPPGRDEMARRIVDTMPSHPWLVCDVGGHVAGYAYATRHRVRTAYQWSVDTSVYVGTTYQRSGVGRGLYVSLFSILTAQGFFNAYAGITLPNRASVALHEWVGFTRLCVYQRVGYKAGSWHDVGWWQMMLKAHDEPPAAPLDVAAVRNRSDWSRLLASGEAVIRAGAATSGDAG